VTRRTNGGLSVKPDWQADTVANGNAQIETFRIGNPSGPRVVLLPSLGRHADDFGLLGEALAAAGYRAVAVNPRGVGQSSGTLQGITLGTLAADVRKVILANGGRAAIVGHAFGQRVARLVARNYPGAVQGLILLAAGGQVPGSEEAAAHASKCFDLSLPLAERLGHVAKAYFSAGNDPRPWTEGWYPDAAAAQRAAFLTATPADWWKGGDAPVLVVQPADDVQAPPANADFLKAQLGARVQVVTVAGAGHALLPEQPEAVARAVLDWLAREPLAEAA
jgi:pimeloyl-ACP methyl ester carboxylesterase